LHQNFNSPDRIVLDFAENKQTIPRPVSRIVILKIAPGFLKIAPGFLWALLMI